MGVQPKGVEGGWQSSQIGPRRPGIESQDGWQAAQENGSPTGRWLSVGAIS